MTDPVDRVANVIYQYWYDHGLSTDEHRKSCARAAIAEMREPTEAMINIGSGYIYEGYGHGPSIAKEAWQAVIDEALK